MGLLLQEDFANIFLAAGFEEPVIYTPTGSTVSTIQAIVYRDGNKQTSFKSTKSRMYNIEIDISTDTADGIGKITVNEDTVSFKAKIGDTNNTTFVVAGFVQNDIGAFRLGLKP